MRGWQLEPGEHAVLERQQQQSRADTIEHLVEHLVGALGEEPCSASRLRPHFRESEDW